MPRGTGLFLIVLAEHGTPHAIIATASKCTCKSIKGISFQTWQMHPCSTHDAWLKHAEPESRSRLTLTIPLLAGSRDVTGHRRGGGTDRPHRTCAVARRPRRTTNAGHRGRPTRCPGRPARWISCGRCNRITPHPSHADGVCLIARIKHTGRTVKKRAPSQRYSQYVAVCMTP